MVNLVVTVLCVLCVLVVVTVIGIQVCFGLIPVAGQGLTLNDLLDRRFEGGHPCQLTEELLRRSDGGVIYDRGRTRWVRDPRILDSFHAS